VNTSRYYHSERNIDAAFENIGPDRISGVHKLPQSDEVSRRRYLQACVRHSRGWAEDHAYFLGLLGRTV
jgi:hypothetical protein